MIFPNIFKNSFDISRNKKISIFVIIAVSSLLIRLSYVSFDVPLFFDNLTYFNYAIEISKLGQLPQTYYLANNGWSIFLSFFKRPMCLNHNKYYIKMTFSLFADNPETYEKSF